MLFLKFILNLLLEKCLILESQNESSDLKLIALFLYFENSKLFSNFGGFSLQSDK